MVTNKELGLFLMWLPAIAVVIWQVAVNNINWSLTAAGVAVFVVGTVIVLTPDSFFEEED